MNYSFATLHVIGSSSALDKHQGELIQRTLQRLYRSYGYAARCADAFNALRVSPDYLKVHFSTCEGCVPAGIAAVSQVLFENAASIVYPDALKYGRELAERLGITCLQTSTESVARFALVPGAKLAYTSDPVFQAVLPVVQYTNADPATGRYERGAIPEAELSYLVLGPHEFDQLRSNIEHDEAIGPYSVDLVLNAPPDPRVPPDVMLISRKPRWTTSPDLTRLVTEAGPNYGKNLEQHAGVTAVSRFEELADVAPRTSSHLVPQTAAQEDQLITLLTWANESDSFSKEHAYLVVETGPDDGFSCYHPPISRQEFAKGLVKFTNYLAAPLLRDEEGEYPRTINTKTMDEAARAAWEIECQAKAKETGVGDAEPGDL